MNAAALKAAWGELRAQLQGNPRLRWGGWLILGIVWMYALLVAGDAVRAERERAAALVEQVERLRPAKGSNPWPQRAEDARQQVAALRSQLWSEGVEGAEGAAADIGLAEAGLQDWVRATAARSGLRLREMALARAPTAADTVAARAATTPLVLPIRLRLSLEWTQAELMAFLSEIGRHERVIVVERLQLRPAVPLGSAEIELRVMVAAVAVAATAPANPAAPAAPAAPTTPTRAPGAGR